MFNIKAIWYKLHSTRRSTVLSSPSVRLLWTKHAPSQNSPFQYWYKSSRKIQNHKEKMLPLTSMTLINTLSKGNLQGAYSKCIHSTFLFFAYGTLGITILSACGPSGVYLSVYVYGFNAYIEEAFEIPTKPNYIFLLFFFPFFSPKQLEQHFMKFLLLICALLCGVYREYI